LPEIQSAWSPYTYTNELAGPHFPIHEAGYTYQYIGPSTFKGTSDDSSNVPFKE